METKMEVKINNMEYTIVSNEPEEYVQRVALLVNKRISEVKNTNGHLSTAMLAVMAGMNLADELLKNEEALSNLRSEIGGYLDEARRTSAELEEKKLEVETLKEDMHKLEIELAKRDTEIENLRSIQTQQRQTAYRSESAQQQYRSAQTSQQRNGYQQRQESAPIQEMQAKYGSNVISRGIPKKTND